MKEQEKSPLEQLIVWAETASKQSIIDKAHELLKIEKENNPIEEKNQKIIELMQVLEMIEASLQKGNSIRPDSFIIRNAIRLSIGLDTIIEDSQVCNCGHCKALHECFGLGDKDLVNDITYPRS